MRQIQFSGLLGVLLFLPAASRAEWVWRNPSTTTNTLTALSQGGGRYVAVGKAGTVVVSTDGRTWEAMSTGLTVDLHEVAYGGGIFVAAGSHGTLAWSPDGRRWHRGGEPGAAFTYRSVAWNGTRFIAVSDSPGVPAVWSEDGMAWTTGDVAAGGFTHIACTATLCLATGRPGSIAVTTDGSRWEWKASPSPDPACGDGAGAVGEEFAVYCQGSLYRTRDGNAWTRDNPLLHFPIADIAPWRGGVITAGFENIYDNGGREAKFRMKSASGAWSAVGPYLRGGMHAVLGDGDLGLVAGDQGRIFAFGPDAVFAPAGRRMTGEHLLAIAGSGGRLVAVGSGMTLLHGTDDSTWTSVPRDPDRYGAFRAVAWSGSRFVAVGDAGIAASSDGQAWIWTQEKDPGFGFGGVVWAGGRFIAQDYGGKSWVSMDGTEWRMHRAGNWGGLAWNGAEAVIITRDSVLASRDGLVWEYRGPPGLPREMPPHPPEVAGFAGLLLARPGTWQDTVPLARSSDGGRTWERIDIAGYPPPLRVFSIASGFVAVTRGAGGVGVHTLHYSADGLAWTPVDIPMERPPGGILEDRGKLILVGEDGALISAARADLPFPVGIRKAASKSTLARPVEPGRSRFPWRGRVFDAAGRSRPVPLP